MLAKQKRISPEHEYGDLDENRDIEEKEPRPEKKAFDEFPNLGDDKVVVAGDVPLAGDEYEDFDAVNCVVDDKGEIMGDACWRRHIVMYWCRCVYDEYRR